MGRSRREGRVRGLGRRRAITAGRPRSAFLRRGSNATFRMQRRAQPVCSGSQGPGAGSQLASVSEIRSRGGGGGRWANTRRPPQSLVLDSARGGVSPAVTWPFAGVWWGEPRPLTHPGGGGLGASLRGGSAACAAKRMGAGGAGTLGSQGGDSQEASPRGGGAMYFFPFLSMLQICTFSSMSTHWRTNSRKNWVGTKNHDRRTRERRRARERE